MSTIGSLLKEARNKKSVTFEEVHAKTKIHPRVLQLLEDDKFDKLPSPLFARSFLRSYAEFLEINVAEITQAYENLSRKEPEPVFSLKPENVPAEEKKPIEIDKKFFIIPLMTFGIFLALVLGFYVLKGGWYLVQKASSGLSAKLHRDNSKDDRAFEKKPAKEKASKEKASKKEKEEAAEKNNEFLRSPDQGNFPVINSKKPLELKIKALDKVWLKITSDGKVLFQGFLARGASEDWEAHKSLDIWTGNAGNMFVTINGSNLGSPGKGMVKKMIITHEGVKISPQENR